MNKIYQSEVLFEKSNRLNPKKIRPYQEKAIIACKKCLDDGDNPLLVLPTGTGKTIVFAEIIKEFFYEDKNSLVIAHRNELINQAIDKIELQSGILCGKEKAEEYSSGQKVVVASVQTMKGKRLERFDKNNFNLVVVDEAHHSTADSYKNIFDYFSKSSILGVTATPDRADEKELSEIFNTIAYQYLLTDAIKDGWLCDIKGTRVKDFVIDLSDLRTRYGDFAINDLDKIMTEYIAPIAKAVKDKSEDRKALIFMPSVASSGLLSDALIQTGIKAGFVSGTTSDEERENILRDFNRGKITHLVNCDLFTEGFDEPSIDCIVMASPTKSRSKYAQRVGRGTRLYDGKKDLLLVEFTYDYKKHNLVSAYELFTGKGFEQKIRDRAIKKDNEKDIFDFLDSLEESHREYYSFDRVMNELIIKEHGFQEYNPFELANLEEIDLTGELNITWNGFKLRGAISEKQLEVLKRFNINNAENLSKAQASCMIDIISKNSWNIKNLINKAKDRFNQLQAKY